MAPCLPKFIVLGKRFDMARSLPYEERGREPQAREECSGDSHLHPPHRKRRLTLYLLFVLLRRSIWPWPQLLDLCLVLLWGVDHETTHHPGVAKAATFPPRMLRYSPVATSASPFLSYSGGSSHRPKCSDVALHIHATRRDV